MKKTSALVALMIFASIGSSAQAGNMSAVQDAKKDACYSNCHEKQMSIKRQGAKNGQDERKVRAKARAFENSCRAKCAKMK